VNKRQGWLRLWVLVTAVCSIAAMGWAYVHPDLYAGQRDLNSDFQVTAKTNFARIGDTWRRDGTFKITNCVPGTLRYTTEIKRDIFAELYEKSPIGEKWPEEVARCTSFRSALSKLSVALIGAVVALIVGCALVWVQTGFSRKDR
jgi:hypothetical protein